MLKNHFYTTLIVLFTVILAYSCTGYDKVMKSEDVNLKFNKAFYFYNKGDYIKAGSLFDQLAPLTRGTRRADSVYFFQAMTQYKLSDYIISSHYFSVFVKLYENSHFIEEAAYMEAYCYYLQSPRPELDQVSTNQALDAFRLYMIKYPKSPRITDCQRIILELNQKLQEKDFVAARLYFNLDDYKAAIVALNNCLIDYPETKFREEIMFMLLKSKFQLAVNSIQMKKTERYQDTVDEYYSFVTEFPESPSKNEAESIYKEASKHIKDTDTEIHKN